MDNGSTTRLIPKFIREDSALENGENRKSFRSFRYMGLLCALTSGLCYSFVSVIVKIVTEISPLQLSFVRFFGVMLPTTFLLIYEKKIPWPKEKHAILFLRAALGCFAVTAGLFAVRFLALGDASTIMFSSPIFVAVLARIILKEAFTLLHLFIIFLGLVGITLVSRPPFLFGGHEYNSQDMLFGITSALFYVLSFSAIYVLMRLLADIHYAIVLFHFSVAGTLSCGCVSLYLGTFTFPSILSHQLFTLAVAILSFLGQFFLTKALQLEDAGPVSIVRSMDIVFAFLWQYVILNVEPVSYSIIGAVLVICSVILTGVKKVIDGPA